MLKPDPKTLEQLKRMKGSAFLVDSFSDGYEPVPQKVLDTVDYLIGKGTLKAFYRFYMVTDPGKYVDYDRLEDVPYDQSVVYPPTGEEIFIPRYGEPNKYYYFASDEKYVKSEVEIHAERF